MSSRVVRRVVRRWWLARGDRRANEGVRAREARTRGNANVRRARTRDGTRGAARTRTRTRTGSRTGVRVRAGNGEREPSGTAERQRQSVVWVLHRSTCRRLVQPGRRTAGGAAGVAGTARVPFTTAPIGPAAGGRTLLRRGGHGPGRRGAGGRCRCAMNVRAGWRDLSRPPPGPPPARGPRTPVLRGPTRHISAGSGIGTYRRSCRTSGRSTSCVHDTSRSGVSSRTRVTMPFSWRSDKCV